MDNRNYAIDNGDGDQITCGLQGYDHARRVAQRMADERGESIYLYEDTRADEADEAETTAEEIAPTTAGIASPRLP